MKPRRRLARYSLQLNSNDCEYPQIEPFLLNKIGQKTSEGLWDYIRQNCIYYPSIMESVKANNIFQNVTIDSIDAQIWHDKIITTTFYNTSSGLPKTLKLEFSNPYGVIVKL